MTGSNGTPRVRALVLRGPGSNCDRETEHALSMAGAEKLNEDMRANIPDVDLGIDDEQLEAIRESVPEEFAELSEAFSH